MKIDDFILLSYEKKIYMIIIQNIMAQSETLRDLSIQILTVLASGSLEIKFELLMMSLSQTLTSMFQHLSLNPGILFNSIKLILVLNQQKSVVEDAIKEQYALLDILFQFFKSDDLLVLTETFLGLSILFETNAYQDKVTNQNLFQEILTLSDIDNAELKYNILKTIRNICNWGEEYIKYFLENKILFQVNKCLDSNNTMLKKISLELVITFLSGKIEFLQTVFEYEKTDIVKKLIHIIKFGEEDTPVLAFKAFTVACTTANFKEMKILIDKGYLDILGSILRKPKDLEVKTLCEKSLEAIVYKTQEAFGKEKHPMILQCYTKVQTIVKSIYGSSQNNLSQAIGIISMENQKNFMPNSNI